MFYWFSVRLLDSWEGSRQKICSSNVHVVLFSSASLIPNWEESPSPGLDVITIVSYLRPVHYGFSYCCPDDQTGQSEVFMLQPFTSKDFAIRTLADRISDLKHLIYLYPDIPKDQAFGKYYTPFTENQAPSNGYVKPLLITHVPG